MVVQMKEKPVDELSMKTFAEWHLYRLEVVSKKALML